MTGEVPKTYAFLIVRRDRPCDFCRIPQRWLTTVAVVGERRAYSSCASCWETLLGSAHKARVFLYPAEMSEHVRRMP